MLRQRIFEILIGFSKRQVFKNISQVSIGVYAIGLGGFDQCKDGGTGLGPIGAAGK
jgi:hypothetical protein